jgi:hypothetical protein
MKPISQPHDPLDELLAAAVHGELTPAQCAELDALLQHDPAARAAYQEIQTMHDLLENNHREVKPDPNFEDRMISGVRRKVREEKAPRETAWESALFIWRGLGALFGKPSWKSYAGALAIVLILAGVALGPVTNGIKKTKYIDQLSAASQPQITYQRQQPQGSPALASADAGASPLPPMATAAPVLSLQQKGDIQTQLKQGFASDHSAAVARIEAESGAPMSLFEQMKLRQQLSEKGIVLKDSPNPAAGKIGQMVASPSTPPGAVTESAMVSLATVKAIPAPAAPAFATDMGQDVDFNAYARPMLREGDASESSSVNAAPDIHKQAAAPALLESQSQPSRKLVRDATLDLEVKAYQPAVDTITALATADGGYLDSSNSQRGGNGKLQGTVVAKVAPDKLDAFLLKLRELGDLKNQSVSTEDVTKDYYDTQARLDNSRRMETQLQELLKRDTGRVSDLLQVERELGRVRGEIEQMQGQLKLYDFQVQYATVTISLAEKDLNKAAAYLLQEHDQFALFVRNVEDAFAQAKTAADASKAEILNADLEHESDNTMSATLAFSVPPEQVDAFLAKVKALGRVDNFTRTTQRVARDGGDPDQPADETRTDHDNAQVQLTIRADDESPRQQTQLAIASTGDIDTQAQQLKDDAAKSGAAVTASSFERATDGTETAVITFRLALAKVGDFMPGLEKLGRVESLSVQRNDRPDQTPADAEAPAEIDLRLHNVAAASFENEPARQETQLTVASSGDVDAQAQQLKGDALKSGVSVTGSTFDRLPDGTEQAALTFRLPLAQAAAFTATMEKLGKVESLAIQRNDVTGADSSDPNAPAEISLTLHNEPAVVAEDRGFWPTLRHLCGGGVTAFLSSVETIGVLAAFLAPWVATAAALAFVARRVWVLRARS